MSAANSTDGSFVDSVFGPVVKGVALLIAGGYISLRAHLNYLGVSGPAYLGAERYLMEAYLFIGGLFDVLIWLALPTLVVVAGYRMLKSASPAAWAGNTQQLRRLASPILSVAALLFLLALIGLMLASSSVTDLIVGDLRNQAIPERRPYMFTIAMIGATVWCVIVARERLRPAGCGGLFGNDLPRPIAHALMMAITLGYALAVPLIYGRERHPTSYPLARIASQGTSDKPVCGIVVLHWPEGIMLWDAVNGRGRLTSIALDRTSAIQWGDTRNILDSLAAARLTGQVPDCSADFPDTASANAVLSPETGLKR